MGCGGKAAVEGVSMSRRITHLVAAAPGTCALYVQRDGSLDTEPVVAWGAWDDSDDSQGSGPLVVDEFGCMSPAARCENYCGVRIPGHEDVVFRAIGKAGAK
jgi:hypothetical protein